MFSPAQVAQKLHYVKIKRTGKNSSVVRHYREAYFVLSQKKQVFICGAFAGVCL